VRKLGKAQVSKGKKLIVDNPTELLRGLCKGIQVKEPVKQELIKASAMMVERKLARSKDP
jgi:hypothetical protein